jgi:quercetin dioxygenase-like cupin family protein
MKSLLPRLALLLVLTLAPVLPAAGQSAGFSRKIILEQDLSTPGKRAAMALIEFAPGAVAPKHTHPGDELIYVLEGSVTLEIDGQPARLMQAGDTFLIPAGAVHLGRNPGGVTARAVSTFVLDKGQPLATPAK